MKIVNIIISYHYHTNELGANKFLRKAKINARKVVNTQKKIDNNQLKEKNDSWLSDIKSTVRYFGKKEDKNQTDTIVDYVLRDNETFPNKLELTNALGRIEYQILYNVYKANKSGSIKSLLYRMYKTSFKGNYILIPSKVKADISLDDKMKYQNQPKELTKKSTLNFSKSNLFAIDIDKTSISPTQLLEDIQSLQNMIAGIIPTPSNLKPDSKGVKRYSYRLLFVSKSDEYVEGSEYYANVLKGLIEDVSYLLTKTYDDKSIIEVDLQMPLQAYQKIRCGKGQYLINNEVVVIDPSYYAKKVKEKKFILGTEKKIDIKTTHELEEKYLNATNYIPQDVFKKLQSKVTSLEERDTWLGYTYALVHVVLLGFAKYNEVNNYYLTLSDGQKGSDKLFEKLYNKAIQNDMEGNPAQFAMLRKVYVQKGGNGNDIMVTTYKNEEDDLDDMDRKIHINNREIIRLFKKGNKNVVMREIEKYIHKDFLLEDVFNNDKEKYLLAAPTGSGKTKALFDSIDTLQSVIHKRKDNLILIAVPNCSNVLQNDSKFNPNYYYGSASIMKKDFKNSVLDSYATGNNVYVSTFDSIFNIYQILKKEHPGIRISNLIIDEVHQLTTSYGYRARSCTGLIELMTVSNRVLGMTGTVKDVNPVLFNKLVIYSRATDDKIPAKNMNILQYKGKELVEYLSICSNKYLNEKGYEQLLIFIENKTIQNQISKYYDLHGITYIVCNAENKDSPDVSELLKREANDCQVILATSFMSDGISLNNDSDKKQAVFICTGSNSNIYSASMVRQMSNRYRNPYNELLWFRPRINDNESYKYEQYVPSVNKLYDYNLKISEIVHEDLSKLDLIGDAIKRDVIEKHYNIKFCNNKNTNCLEMTIDKQGVYHRSYEDRANRNKKYILNLQSEIEKMLGLKFINTYHNCGLNSVFEELDEIKNNQKEREEQKLEEYMSDIYTKISLSDFKYISNNKILEEAKLNISNDYDEKERILNAMPQKLREVVKLNCFLSYELCIKSVVDVIHNKKAKNTYYNICDTYISILEYQKQGKYSTTYKIVNDILQTVEEVVSELGISDKTDERLHALSGEYLLKEDLKTIKSKIYEKSPYDKKAIDKVLKKYMNFKRVKQVRLYVPSDDIHSSENVLNNTNIEDERKRRVGLYIYSIYDLEDLKKSIELNEYDFYQLLLEYVERFHTVSDKLKTYLRDKQRMLAS